MLLAVPLLLHVALSIPPGVLPPAVRAAAVAEAAAIWHPYGIVVFDADSCDAPAEDIEWLIVEVVTEPSDPRRPKWRPPLGALGFTQGAPEPRITLFYSEITRIVALTRAFEANETVWPVALRQRTIGRVTGRVIAHEIGHYLLHDPGHTPMGLMQAQHTGDDLASPVRHTFELSKETADRLAWLTGRAAPKEKGPAPAGPSSPTIVKR